MSVRINVSANADQVTAAFAQIQAAIDRAGQQGKAFSQLDMSHPELAKFAKDLELIQKRLQDVARMGRGETAAAVRSITGSRTPDLTTAMGQIGPGTEQRYLSPADRQRFLAQLAGALFTGTAFGAGIPNVPGPSTAAGAPGGGSTGYTPGITSGGGWGRGRGGRGGQSTAGAKEGEDMGGLAMTGLMSVFAGPLAFLLEQAGMSSLKGIANQALGGASDEAVGNDRLLRMLRDTSTDFEGLRQSVRDATKGLGLTIQQTQKFATMYTKIAGYAPGDASVSLDNPVSDMLNHVRLGAGIGRSNGMDQGASVQAFARLERGGVAIYDAAGILGDAVRNGNMAGQADVILQTMTRWTESQARTGADSHIAEFASMYAAMNRTGAPALRGDNAMSTLSTIDQAIRSGGGGDAAVRQFTYRAFASAGVTNSYDIQYAQEGGMFEHIGGDPNKPTLYQTEMTQLNKEYAGRPENERLAAMERVLHIPMRVGKMLTPLSMQDSERTLKYFKANNIDPASLDPTSFTAISKVLDPTTPSSVLRKMATDLGNRSSDADATMIRGSMNDPKSLKEIMVRVLGEQGMSHNQGLNTTDANANLSNNMTRLGQDILGSVNAFKDASNFVVKGLADLADVLKGGGKEVPGTPNTITPDGRILGPDGRGRGIGPDGVYPASFMTSVRAGAGDGRLPLISSMLSGIGGGGGTARPNTAAQQKLAQQAFDYFRSQGWTSAQASGLVAQLHKESGFNAGAVGDGGAAYGALLWHADRQANFVKWSGHSIRSSTFQEQLAFMQWELTHTEKAAGDRLRNTTSAFQAGGVASQSYVRPRDVYGEMNGRGNDAQRMLPGLRAGRGSPIAPSIAASGPPGVTQASYHQIAPLRVVHETPSGRVLREEHLPVTNMGPSRPWGGTEA